VLQVNKIPMSMLKVFRNEFGWSDSKIADADPEDLLDAWLEWEGIIGYTNLIVGHLDDLREAEIGLQITVPPDNVFDPNGKSWRMQVDEDTKLIRTLVSIIEDFMPNIANCCLQDIGRLNTGLIEADARLKMADAEKKPVPLQDDLEGFASSFPSLDRE
jgi:hypothetical protein